MRLVEAITTCFRKSFRFSGRASRSEFWWFTSACIALYWALSRAQAELWGWTLKNGPSTSIFTSAFALVIALPLLAAAVRRIQDVGLHPVLIFIPLLMQSQIAPAFLRLGRAIAFFEGSSSPAASYPENVLIHLGHLLLWPLLTLGLWVVLGALLLLRSDFIDRAPDALAPASE